MIPEHYFHQRDILLSKCLPSYGTLLQLKHIYHRNTAFSFLFLACTDDKIGITVAEVLLEQLK
jgi:hypothetical protein